MAQNKADYLHLQLCPADADTVKRIARGEDRSYASVVRRALRFYEELHAKSKAS